MDNKNEDELNDISAYYENTESKTDNENHAADDSEKIESADTDTAEPNNTGTTADTTETDTGSTAGTEESGSNEGPENPDAGKSPSKLSAKAYAASIAAAIAIIAGGFTIGRLVVPVPDGAVTDAAQRMLKTDKDYLAATDAGKKLQSEIDELNAANERINNAFNDVVEYEKQLDDLKQNFQVLNDELYNSRGDLERAKNTDNDIQSELSALQSRTITLSPGTYTVGTHIPSGTYLTTGNGSLLTAGADKTLKTNVNLDKNTPYRCSLADSDTIKLSTEAVFKPEEDEQ